MSMGVTGAVFREGLMLVAGVGGPLFLAMLVAGLAIGVLQAATQVNDPAVSFLPRMAVGGLVLWFGGNWMMERLARFLAQSIARMAGGF